MNRKLLTIITLVIVMSSQHESVFAQKDTSDYFAIGIYGGFYVGKTPIRTNKIPNAIAFEAEYYKFRDLSFYVSGLYEFTPSNKRYIRFQNQSSVIRGKKLSE